ncbi:MAG TPA: ribosome biogenesis GTP-binding protein YihA/YsxC [Bacteroidales bacterium]|nr:ribosome biogenesis GTP-binding protein YihA/YsxC [Bacteroidales bacterium]HPS16402.1 ribosome biogenesis GTP-binding protein YihA/YsxC [Bacteroidales bacterium]
MLISSAQFIKSSKVYTECPKPNLPEYAFIGRSNVGKSSLINMICSQKKLAKTSSTPGKTQLINHFIINENWYIADLPGYGFAKISKDTRARWEKMIMNYLLNRNNLMNTFVLVDSRLEPQAIDMEFINWLGLKQIPFSIVFTKTDKLKEREIIKNTETFKKALLEEWDELPPAFITSSETKKGKEEILRFIEETNTLFTS